MTRRSQFMFMFCAFVALAYFLDGFVTFQTRSHTRQSLDAYRTIDAAFEIHRSQGWSLTSAPTDGRRYRICGAMQSDPTSGVALLSGLFAVGNRSVSFEVKVPKGKVVAVEGLDPIDGGSLTYGVLTQGWPEEK